MNKIEKEFDDIYVAYESNEQTPLYNNTRERINWICNQAVGMEILDIGCSQGIVPILLGRKQMKVLGIDILDEAIEFAKNKLSCEDKNVQKNVDFLLGDFMKYDFNNIKFDTIILTEVLEHLIEVEPFLDKVRSCLKEDGHLIVTVPFGINDYWDHKRTYYLGGLYNQLNEWFDIINIEYIHKWLGVVCLNKEQNDKVKINLDLLIQEEKEFYKLERQLIDDNNKIKVYNKEQKQKLINSLDTITNLKDKLQERQVKIRLSNEYHKELKSKIQMHINVNKDLKKKLHEQKSIINMQKEIIKDLKNK